MTELKTPTENVINLLKNKSVLFLENDNVLANGLDTFESILKDAKIEYKVLYDLSSIPLNEITKAINNYDAIVFQTRWTWEISKKLLEYVRSLKTKKIIVECYINEPTWYYKKQHASKHDVYIYSCLYGTKEYESFYKLTNKPYWNYKNNFDK